ncbi:MAG: tRNA pseudouridine(38-40) synthase TruA [Gemmatimonadales bacterium]
MAAQPTLLLLQYDGGSFAGWQRQPSARTVQGVVEDILARLLEKRTPVIGSGRTDAGVHATGQAAAAMVPERWEPGDLMRAMNALLPSDVWVAAARRMVPGFNPRRDALERTYCYRIGTDVGGRSPFRSRHEWALSGPLDVPRLGTAAAALIGEHSFRALSAKGPEKDHYRCRILEALWLAREDAAGLEFWITANRFLHHMVRFLVGTMVDIARGRREPSDLAKLLRDTDNSDASPPAPPHGLFLVGVRYPAHLFAEAP